MENPRLAGTFLLIREQINCPNIGTSFVKHLSFPVPIIPEFLYDINHPNAPLDKLSHATTTKATPTPNPCAKYMKDVNITSTTSNYSGKIPTLKKS